MKANVLFTAALIGVFSLAAVAQGDTDRITLPSGGIILDFKMIDRNNDRSISVEEWNDFIASLRERKR